MPKKALAKYISYRDAKKLKRMSSYKGWLKITWLHNVILTAVCNRMYTQLDIHIFVWTVCWCTLVTGDCSDILFFIDGSNIELSFFILSPQPDYFTTAEYWHTLRAFIWMLKLDSCGKFL